MHDPPLLDAFGDAPCDCCPCRARCAAALLICSAFSVYVLARGDWRARQRVPVAPLATSESIWARDSTKLDPAEKRRRERARQKRWRAENRERVRALERKRRAENIDRFRARQRKWRAENLDKINARNRARSALKRAAANGT